MGLISFGSGLGGMGGNKNKKDDVNIFSLSKEDRQRQRELLARQERNSYIQVIFLGVALLFILVAFFSFRAMGGPVKPAKPPTPAAGSNDTQDEIKLGKMLDELTSPDVRPTLEELAVDFEPLPALTPAAIAAGIDETNLTAEDAYTRNRPNPAMVAEALRYLRTHQETLRDFKADSEQAALPGPAVQQPDLARGRFATLQGYLEQVDKEYCGYGYLPIEDAAQQKASGAKELHLYYFDVAEASRKEFYFGQQAPSETDPVGSGLPSKLGKFAVLVPSDLRPNYEANLPDIDAGYHPKAHLMFSLRMNGIFLGNHLVLQPVVGNSNKRVVVPLYLAVDPLPWRPDMDKPARLGEKIKTKIIRQARKANGTKPGEEIVVSEDAEVPAAGGAAGGTVAGAGDPGAEKPRVGAFIPMSPVFKPLETITGTEDEFDAIPTGNSIEEIKEASEYIRSYEPFHLIIRYFRSHTPEQIREQMHKREADNMAATKDGSKSAANYTNTVNNPVPYYGQPYEFQAWVVKCWNPRDFWEQDYGQETGLKAESGVTHTSTWLVRDDRVNFYVLTMPKSTQEILGAEFKGDLDDLTPLNLRIQVQGIFLQRLPLQKQNFEFSTVPMFVVMDFKKVVIPPSNAMTYNYAVALVLGCIFLLIIWMIYRDRKPDAVVRDKTRENMFKRLRKTGKLTHVPGTPIAHPGQQATAGAGAGTGTARSPAGTPPPAESAVPVVPAAPVPPTAPPSETPSGPTPPPAGPAAS